MNSVADQQLSPRTQAALQYLRRLKPLDGYAVERYIASSGNHQVRLKRRNIPVHDEGFEEIVVDRSAGNVVGIQVMTSRGDAGRGIVLVDKNGKLCDNESTVTVQMANVSTTSSAGSSQRRSDPTRGSSSRSRASSTTATSTTTPLSDADNQLIIQYGLMALGALVLFKIIFAAVNVLLILLIPMIYLYASGNCPSNDTFDAKKELKRVMRGAHLPEENQPKGFFEQGFNRLAASVTTELATSLGYEISITDFVGAAKMASVKVPIANAEFYWVGIFGKWRFMGQREIPEKRND